MGACHPAVPPGPMTVVTLAGRGDCAMYSAGARTLWRPRGGLMVLVDPPEWAGPAGPRSRRPTDEERATFAEYFEGRRFW